MKSLPDMTAIDVTRTLCSIDRQIGCIHSHQVWVSGYKPQRNKQMTPISMNTSANTIYIDVMRTLCSIDRQIEWIDSQKVWVSGYKLQRNN